MMKLFAVRDVKSGIYHTPFFQRTIAEAMRGWETAVNDGNTIMSRFPDDFRLEAIAEFDDNTGKLNAFELPQILATGLDVKTKAPTPLFEQVKA